MFHKFENRLTLKGNLEVQTALRIGAGRSIEPTGTDLPVVKDTLGNPYIPGSSFKGILRSYVEQLVRAQVDGKRGACDPLDPKSGSCVTDDDMEKMRKKAEGDEDLTRRILQKTCMVCELFGSPWLASRIRIKDLLVDETLWFGQFQTRDGVAIDRDTGTASDKKLYNFEVVPAGCIFKCEIVVENAEEWQLGMLMIGLKAFENGEISMGGGTSRGLGSVRLNLKEKRYFKLNGNLDQYLQFVKGEYAGKNADESTTAWMDAFKDEIRRRQGNAEEADQ